jgi:hypothetical protein
MKSKRLYITSVYLPLIEDKLISADQIYNRRLRSTAKISANRTKTRPLNCFSGILSRTENMLLKI